MSDETKFDFIVVGGGTAGVVIASRLSQKFSVALIEAGSNDVFNPHVTDRKSLLELIEDGIVLDYSSVPQSHCDDRNMTQFAGRTVSGSSAVNIGVWTRASRTDYEVIAEKAGHARFTFEGLLPYFKRTERFWDTTASRKYHGFDGPIHTAAGRQYPMRKILQESFVARGVDINPDPFDGDPTGLSDLCQNFRVTSSSDSTRQHSARVYDLSRVHVMDSTFVRRILFQDGRATGIQLLNGNQLHARREVIISCGAYKTPQLLMLSGIGPASELSKHSVPQIVDSPEVGRNLFDHNSLKQYYRLRHPEKGFALPFTGTAKPEYGQGAPSDFLAFQTLPTPDLQAALAADDPSIDASHPHLRPKRCHHLSVVFYFPLIDQPNYSAQLGRPLDGTHISLISFLLLPTSRGTITLPSTDPTAHPVIDPNYLSTAADRYTFRAAVRRNLELAETGPLASELIAETPPDGFPALTSRSNDEEIDARIRRFCGTIYHPQGTAALGTVLDAEFRVKGVRGLRVCDASVFPEAVGAMPQATVYAFAELAAELIGVGNEGE
ncbi:putative glucose dehydrogenase [Mytilinidion resinicola]|uniref:Glucose dehydrogenase n=1 Tax=Mytilinidion resinicola TaxID=574789 RepID=A0A6A6Y127_9PEZI|nr:putative glucose dehydrogenase [Mytilinidion resinicola]KAF2802516.1 putative glucose dehydrogenase [Mytilinidion resinicola]